MKVPVGVTPEVRRAFENIKRDVAAGAGLSAEMAAEIAVIIAALFGDIKTEEGAPVYTMEGVTVKTTRFVEAF